MSNMVSEIKEIARLKGISNKEIANRVGVTEGTVSRWFKGTRSPQIEYVEKLLDAVGVEEVKMKYSF